MATVSLRHVTKCFDGDVIAVKDANIAIEDKEFVVLVGPSGCGKSTTLRMIAGLEEATEGEIYIDELLVNHVPPKDRDIAMVFQNYALYPHMTVYQNMAFGLKLRKFKNSEIDERVQRASEILGIQTLLNRKPKALSGGQRQRVAVGRAIVRKPKVFLFDEPLSNLDAKLRVQMRAEINKLHTQLQATMIYVTHDQVEAMTMGDRIVVMKDGIIHQTDTPLDIYKYPVNLFVAGFIGSPAMNFFDGTISTSDGKTIFRGDGYDITLPDEMKSRIESFAGREVIFGVRPEDFYCTPDDSPYTAAFSAPVEVIEPMGNEIFLYFTRKDTSFIARVDPDISAKIGEEIELSIDLKRVHFFDRETEKRIS
jgi:multiple sugar transport system ATP-binding protein